MTGTPGLVARGPGAFPVGSVPSPDVVPRRPPESLPRGRLALLLMHVGSPAPGPAWPRGPAKSSPTWATPGSTSRALGPGLSGPPGPGPGALALLALPVYCRGGPVDLGSPAARVGPAAPVTPAGPRARALWASGPRARGPGPSGIAFILQVRPLSAALQRGRGLLALLIPRALGPGPPGPRALGPGPWPFWHCLYTPALLHAEGSE